VSPTHRQPDGTRRVGPTWESLVERQIREAQEEGAFDELPHQGAPLPLDDDAAAGEWALAHRMLKNAGAAPPWIEADKEARRWLERRDALMDRAERSRPIDHDRLRRELATIVEAANRAVARLNAEAPTIAQHRRSLDPAAERARLEARFRRDGP
jgi:hypothetical protein